MSEFEYLNAGNSEAQDKLATSYLLAQSSTGIARTGVLSGLVVSQTTTASGSVLISAGAGVNQASVLVGASLLVNDTSKTLDIFTANPVGGLPRNDVIVFDATIPGLTVIVGTPNATPADPTIPATVTALARLRHAASATTIPTAKIDDLRVLTYLRGVVPPDDTGWIGPVLQHGWVNFGGAYRGVNYRRMNGIIYVRGLIKNGTTAAGTVLFNLPAGFRPSTYDIYDVWCNGTAKPLELGPSGDVVVGDTAISAFSTSLSFEFPAEA